jgi:hypothetical protein
MGPERSLDKTRTEIRELCEFAGIDDDAFAEGVLSDLRLRVARLLTPNEKWFRQGKTIQRYWAYVNEVTGRPWDPEEVRIWYARLHDPSDTRETIPPSLRYQVLSRDECCLKCGQRPPEVVLHVDHILPWSLGGPTELDNLQTLCGDCNLGKSNRFIEGA